MEATLPREIYSTTLKNSQYGDREAAIREMNLNKDKSYHLQMNDLNTYNEKYIKHRSTLRKWSES